MKGYTRKILRIDLSKEKIKTERLEEGFYKTFIGGKGLGAQILFNETKPKMNPLDPENLLIFALGPVNGLNLSGTSRLGVFFKSPLTGMFGEAYCGGHFAPRLKWAGYDALIIQGQSETPVYLMIDEKAEVRGAEHLWNKDTFETEEIIKQNHGKQGQVLSIGPAGENIVKYATINHAEGRQFGRCGAGAIMGAKKLKAIVVKAKRRSEVSSPEEFKEFRKILNEKVKERLGSLSTYGTPSIMNLTNSTGTLPTRNWIEGEFDGFEAISPDTMKDKFLLRSTACYGCTVACGKVTEVDKGPYTGTKVEGPEYETAYALGSLCGNATFEAIIKANELCDRLGLDTITTGNALAFLMECHEREISLPQETPEEKALTFGNYEMMLEIIPKIAYREGIGDILAEGVRRAAEIIERGTHRFAIHVNGLELPGYDPRGLKGMALAYAASCRGACHLRHLTYRPNLTGSLPFGEGEIDRLSIKGQGRMVREQEDFYAIVDSMTLCKFLCLPTIGPILWEELGELYRIVTGISMTKKALMETGRKINDLVKQYNAREGIEISENSLPERFISDPLRTGASQGQLITREEVRKMMEEYSVS